MKLFPDYKIVTQLKIIIEYYEGELNLEPLIEFKKRQAADKNYSPHYDIIADLRKCDLKINPDEVDSYMEFLVKNRMIVGNRKNAIITQEPYQVVFSELLKRSYSRLSKTIEIFSSVSAALNWINKKDLNLEKFNKIMRDIA